MIVRRAARSLGRRLLRFAPPDPPAPLVLLEPRHLESCRVLRSRDELVARLPRGGIGAEVGVAAGDFAAVLLREASPARLVLIDAWDDPRYRAALPGVEARFARERAAGTIEIMRGPSVATIGRLPDASLDWVYIDTSHSYADTQGELAVARRKIKPGGRIAGHDFSKGNVATALPYGVIQACQEFCRDHEWGFEYLTLESHGDLSYCLRAL